MRQKDIILILFCFLNIVLISCQESNNEKNIVVDKIYYKNEMIAEYIYDNQNRLKKSLYYNGHIRGYTFEYENDKIKKIKYIDHVLIEYNKDIVLYYNSQDQIIRSETYQKNSIIDHENYIYDNGKLSRVFKDKPSRNSNFIPYLDIDLYVDFKNTSNCLQTKELTKSNYSKSDKREEKFTNFQFDTYKKPSFNVGTIFQIELLPPIMLGKKFKLPRNISENNITEIENLITYKYEYNENGYPITIEPKYNSITTSESILFRIEYKELN